MNTTTNYLLFIFISFFCISASAGVITVTNTNDSGPGSLRQAAADVSFGDTIAFDQSINGTPITLTGSFIFINFGMTIMGNGPENTIIDGDGSSRIFWMAGGVVNIEGITFQNGSTNSFGGALSIDAFGIVSINNCRFINNAAQDYGGAIRSWGTLRIYNCSFANNSSSLGGGGVYSNRSFLNIENSSFSENSAPNGGAVYNDQSTLILHANIISDYNGNNDIFGPYTDLGANILVSDPLFVDPLADLRLSVGSPAIDIDTFMTPENTIDILGNDRTLDGDEDGTAITDAGAHEFTGEMSDPCTYVIMSERQAQLKETTVHSGGVGVVSSNSKAKIKNGSIISGESTFVNAETVEVDGSSVVDNVISPFEPFDLPEFFFYQNNGGVDVEVPNNGFALLDNASYEEVEIGNNATVTFEGHETVYLEELDIGNNVTLVFSQCTNLIIKDDVILKKNSSVNVDGNFGVAIYTEGELRIKQGSVIHANAYSLNKMIVSGNVNSPTEVKGLLVTQDKFNSKNYVDIYCSENSNSTCPTPPQSPASAQKNMTIIGPRVDRTNEQTVTLLYPNPAIEILNVQFDSETAGVGALSVYNVAGERVIANDIIVNSGENRFTIDIASMNSGTYFLEVIRGKKRELQKFVIIE